MFAEVSVATPLLVMSLASMSLTTMSGVPVSPSASPLNTGAGTAAMTIAVAGGSITIENISGAEATVTLKLS